MISSLYGSLPSTSSLPYREENINPQLSLYSPIDNCTDSMSLAGQWKPISITHSLLPSPCFPISHSRLGWNKLLCLKRAPAQPEKGDQTERMEMALLHPLLAAKGMSLCGLSWEKAYGFFITVRPLQLPRQEESTREHSGPFVNASTHFRQLGGTIHFLLFRNRIFQEAHGCSCVLFFDLVFLWQMKISSGSCKKKTKRKLWGRGLCHSYPLFLMKWVSHVTQRSCGLEAKWMKN